MRFLDPMLFHTVFEEPLARIVGTPLISVAYDILSSDLAGFDVNAPNESGGCQEVGLTFGGGTIALHWDFHEPAFRDEMIAFYLAIGGPCELDAETRARVAATEALPWRNLVGSVLQQVTLWGCQLCHGGASPQAMSFLFPAGAMTVAIGYSPRTHPGGGVGDGDELLVLGEAQWSEQLSGRPAGIWLMPVWSLEMAQQ